MTQEKLDALTDALVENILSTPDADILKEEREDCETCKGEGREMMDYGYGDIRDVECSMCRGERTKAAYNRALAEIDEINQRRRHASF